jgi:hypothetical protein
VPDSEEVKFFRADFAYATDAPDLERWLLSLLERSASSRGLIAVSHRLKYAYLLRKRNASAEATALVAEAERLARAALDRQPDSAEVRVELAAVSAMGGDATAALDWLRRAYDSGYRAYSLLERDPIFRHQMGDDVRFVAFIDRMRRDVAAQRERAQARGLLELTGLLDPRS